MTTLHILSNPNSVTHKEYMMDAYNNAIPNFISGMMKYDYELIHYGHEKSQVACEHVTVITSEDNDIDPLSNKPLIVDNRLIQIFCENASRELKKRKKKGDIILCFLGVWNQNAVKDHSDILIVEPGIGYALDATFAPYKVFTSYSQMHYYYGLNKMFSNPSWFDSVIPCSFNVEDFEFCDDKDDYFLFLGRVNEDKGIHLCIQIAEHINKKLIIAGPGDLKSMGYANLPSNISHIGYCNPRQRKKLLSKAKALIAPSYYIEPFGNIVIESLMSGTPVITSDWGGFVDTCINGLTGYRCRSFKDFINATKNIDQISSEKCREYAVNNFSIEVVSKKYDEYFSKLINKDFYADY